MSDNAEIEEKKTRLWALSFESTKQIVHCAKCGATNIVNRLVEEPGARPSRRNGPADKSIEKSAAEPGHRFRTSESEVTQAARRLSLEAQLDEAKQEVRKAKKAVFMAGFVSALSSAAVVALVLKSGKRR